MKKSILISVIVMSFATKLYSIGLSNEEFVKRMGTAQQKIRAAEQLETGMNKLGIYLDNLVYSQSGLIKTSSNIISESNTWLVTWNNYLLQFDRIDISDYQRFISDSEKFFTDQAIQLKKIEDRAERLRRESVDILEEITFQYDANPDLSEYQNSLVARVYTEFETLKLAVQTSTEEARNNLGLMRLVQQKAIDAIDLIVKRKLLAQGKLPLESSLTRYIDMSTEAVHISPIRFELEDKALRMSAYALNFAFHHAKILKYQTDQQCLEIRSKISNLPMSNISKSNSLQKINNLCESIRTNWSSLVESGLSNREMAYEYASLMKIKFEKECKNRSTNLNCDQLARLQEIPKEFYDQANDNELLDIEFSWSGIDPNNN